MIPSYQLKELTEARSRAHAAASRLLAGEGLNTPEKRSSFEAAMTEVDNLTQKIAQGQGTYTSPTSARTDLKREMRHAEAFGRFLRKGDNVLTPEQRNILETRAVGEGGAQGAHIGSYSSLGYLVPTGFVDRVEQATKYFCPFLTEGFCNVIKTDTGNALPFPVSDDTGNVATIVAEAGTVSELDITAGQVILQAYKLSSGVIKASMELLQDSSIDIEGWLSARFGERYGRGLEALFTTGTGIAQPTGILTALSNNGVEATIAVGSSANDGSDATGANSVGYTDLVDLEHSVDPTYRRNAKYMFADSTLASLKKLLDKYGRPLWAPGITAGDPATVNGYSYIINQSMPAIAASNQSMLFGDFSKFTIRRVMDLSVQRLVELYAANGQVGFQSFARVDSNLTVASTANCFGILQQHS
jgi:HK97 family phage major capsid protein